MFFASTVSVDIDNCVTSHCLVCHMRITWNDPRTGQSDPPPPDLGVYLLLLLPPPHHGQALQGEATPPWILRRPAQPAIGTATSLTHC